MKKYNSNEFIKEILDNIDDLCCQERFDIYLSDTDDEDFSLIMGIQKEEVLGHVFIFVGFHGEEQDIYSFDNKNLMYKDITNPDDMNEELKEFIELMKNNIDDNTFVSIKDIDKVKNTSLPNLYV